MSNVLLTSEYHFRATFFYIPKISVYLLTESWWKSINYDKMSEERIQNYTDFFPSL